MNESVLFYGKCDFPKYPEARFFLDHRKSNLSHEVLWTTQSMENQATKMPMLI